ncbi:MAG TPA: orotidine 5'-phosphate decarboxylase / HUMPS family protein [Candidatus Saccharimonadales bacterium]|nr:orotidine 5'-phosphate decarboxylase / HUMPS family protein [Candidatus Saccharimonadales bacterium]
MASGEFIPFFGNQKGVVWAADVDPEQFAPTMEQIGDAEGLVGVKIGFEVGLGLSLAEASRIVRAYSDAKVLYDHQKAGNDIPDTSVNFARAMERGNVDGAILFPFTGPRTQVEWTTALQGAGLGVFTGAEMTHPGFKEAEGGSIGDQALEQIIDIALDLGVGNFIVPGNKAASVEHWRKKIAQVRGVGRFAFAAPGFVDQGGSVTEAGSVAGPIWHPIIGRGVHANKDGLTPREAVEYYTAQLREAA